MLNAQFKHLTVSRLILGSNPFSGFSHQSPERDWEMRHYFSAQRIQSIFKDAEALGVNTVIARSDFHVMRIMMESSSLKKPETRPIASPMAIERLAEPIPISSETRPP